VQGDSGNDQGGSGNVQGDSGNIHVDAVGIKRIAGTITPKAITKNKIK
jgi:hypothetical protein